MVKQLVLAVLAGAMAAALVTWWIVEHVHLHMNF